MEQALVELVWQRAHARCEYCRLAPAHSLLSFEIDHIIAKSLSHKPPSPLYSGERGWG
jgi:hypothetical protein